MQDKGQRTTVIETQLPLTCSMGKKVICVCPECIQHWAFIDDQQMPGHPITQQLRRFHEIAAAANCSPNYAKARSSHPVGVEELLDEEEDGKDKSGSSPGAQQSLS
jgi:hypothetical protein